MHNQLFILLTAASAVCALPAPQSGGLGSIPNFGKNDVPNGPAPKGCSKFEIIVARGTSETGPFGVIVGDPLVSAVKKAVPDSRGYAVQYPATLNIPYSPAKGIDDTIHRLNNQNKACPDQKFALVGYSQGGRVIHGALSPTGAVVAGLENPRPKLDSSVLNKILAIVLFGDAGFKPSKGPANKQDPPDILESLIAKVRQNCNPGDPACDPKGSDSKYHLQYRRNPWQKDSAEFIVAAFEGKPLPKAVTSAADPTWAAMAEQSRPKGGVAKSNAG